MLVSREEGDRLDALLGEFGLSRQEVDSDGLWEQVEERRKRAALERTGELVAEAIAVALRTGLGRGDTEGDRDGYPATGALSAPETSQRRADDAEGDATTSALAAIDHAMRKAADEGGLSSSERREALIAGLEAEMDRLVAARLVAADHEGALETVVLHFRFDDEEHRKLNRNGAHARFVQALVLHDLSEGVVRQRQQIEIEGGHLPFRFRESETLLWLFQNVEYQTTEKELDAVLSRGTGILSEDDQLVWDTGLLGVTTEHLYFCGRSRRFRIPHERVVTLQRRADGFGLSQDRPEARPEVFLLDDADFAYELVHSAPAGVGPSLSRPVVDLQERPRPGPLQPGPTRSAGSAAAARPGGNGSGDGGEVAEEDGCGKGCGKGCAVFILIPIGVFVLFEILWQ